MVADLIKLPLRIWVRSARLALRIGEELTGRAAVAALERAADAALELAGALAGARDRSQPPAPHDERIEREPPSRPSPARPRRPAPPRRRQEVHPEPHLVPTPPSTPTEEVDLPAPEPEAAPPPQPVPEPAHVSEEPELVLESAEPGAEDGAGASVTVLEPWEDYERLAARQVVDRLAVATPEELAAVELYESAHRSRRTVLEAVQRQLRSSSGGASAE